MSLKSSADGTFRCIPASSHEEGKSSVGSSKGVEQLAVAPAVACDNEVDDDEKVEEQPCVLCAQPVAVENAIRFHGDLLLLSLSWVTTRAGRLNFLQCSEGVLESSDEELQQDNVEVWRAKFRLFGEDRRRSRRAAKEAAKTTGATRSLLHHGARVAGA